MAGPAMLYLGLMSGTSLDGVDAALLEVGPDRPTLRGVHHRPLPQELRREILALNRPGGIDELDRMGQLDRRLGQLFAETATQLLRHTGLAADDLRAIGSHGQTLRHRPPGMLPPELAFTLQIGDPATIAEHTGILTVADFRRRDLAAGGQGAPLVPAFHQAMFAGTVHRAIVNIGGMANITLLASGQAPTGFDTGPGNVLMDAWCRLHLQQPHDEGGRWAAGGQVDEALLDALLQHPFFAQPPPKSTGRESFHLPWLEQVLEQHATTREPQDIQATLLELTARSIARAIQDAGDVAEVYCCGGGAHNRFLLERLTRLLSPRRVATTEVLGLHPDWVEAAAFGWLAHLALNHQPGSVPEVTGATAPRILGAIYPA